MWDIGKSRLLDQTDLHLNLSLFNHAALLKSLSLPELVSLRK